MSQDPLRDPRFPDRPQSPDFWRIVEVTNQQDGRHTEDGQEVEEIVTDIVDPEALMYMAQMRALKVQEMSGLVPDRSLTAMLGAVWADAFTVGLRFERAGGHRQA